MRQLYKMIGFMIITAVVFQSCTKTKYEQEKRPYNDIMKFVIVGSTGDSTKCLVSGDTISIYWNPDVELPATIRPSIVVEEKATISPASGEEVSLNESTTFKVTAENGNVKTYRLKIVYAVPIPNVSSVTSKVVWLNSSQINIYGEYFLANTDTSQISAYLKRDADGLEIPLELNKKQITNYSIIAKMPEFTAEQGVGLHQLFVKTGNKAGNGIDINFYAPPIGNVNIVSSCEQAGQDIHAGDTLTINYEVSSDSYDGRIADFYSIQEIATVVIYIAYDQTIEVTDLVRTANSIKLKIPEGINKYIGQSLSQCRIYYKTVDPDWLISSSYRHGVYFSSPSAIRAVE